VGAGMDEKRRIKELTGRDVYVREFEEIKKSDRINSAGRASYVERNYWMIDNSEVVIIYWVKENKARGTYLTKKYADIKKKQITNIYLLD
jgi:uncharacterized phage-like protein YoqJ